MEHRLRVTVKLDIDYTSLTLHIAGCLTPGGCRALFQVIQRTHGFSSNLAVLIDLSHARHIDEEALSLLRTYLAVDEKDGDHNVLITTPKLLPSCPALEYSLLGVGYGPSVDQARYARAEPGGSARV